MWLVKQSLIGIVLVLSTHRLLADEEGKQNTCFLKNMRAPGMNPLVRIDENGRRCRINLTIPVCRGYCRTREFGTHEFPHRSQKGAVCVPDGGQVQIIPITDCDEDADPTIRTVAVLKGTKCACKQCDKARMNCMRNGLFSW